MLKREEAQAQLKSFKNENWQAEKIQAIRDNLPQELQSIAFGLLYLTPDGKELPNTSDFSLYSKREPLRQNALQRLACDLTPNQRLQIFEVLFPPLGDYIQKAWELIGTRLPYQNSTGRRAFHAPPTIADEISVEKRTNCLAGCLMNFRAIPLNPLG